MARKYPYRVLVVVLNVLFLGYAVIAIHHLAGKADLPNSDEFRYPLTINGTIIRNQDQLEFVTGQYSIGMPVQVAFAETGSPPHRLTLVPYYETGTIISSILIALVMYGFGLAVYLLRRDEFSARVFHMGAILTASALIGVKTICLSKPAGIGYTAGGLFFLAYAVVPLVFLHFTLVFPSVRHRWYGLPLRTLYALVIIIAVVYHYLYCCAGAKHSISLFETALMAGSVEGIIDAVIFIGGFINLIFSYRASALFSEKQKLRWILFGLCLGPAPFFLLWVLPVAFQYPPLVAEIVFKSFLLLIPLTFAVAIVKYRALDIDLLINRSVVYGTVIAVFLGLYIGVVGLAARIITVWTAQSSLTISIVIAVLTAVLFDPMRRQVQGFVDRSFFRIRYNFREAQRELSEAIMDCFDVAEIAGLMVQKVQELVPVDRIGFFTVNPATNRIGLLAHANYDFLEHRGIQLHVEDLNWSLKRPVALASVVETGAGFETGNEEVLRRWGIAVILPMISRQQDILGFLVLGPKKSGLRFTTEDIDLLQSLSGHTALAIERLALLQKLMLQQAEAQRLVELNATKSYFVSSVSHDLKTPLTSIKMFAELLRERKNLSSPESESFLRIIEGESDRLTRLINNVLDFSRAERGVKEYTFEELELNELVERVLVSMQYQFSVEHCTVERRLLPEPIFINADKDAIMEILDNLLANALRYTPEVKRICVGTGIDGDMAWLSVDDNGIGIAADEIERLGTPFFRTEAAKSHGKGGTGLGLSVVKHSVAAHSGILDISSKPGVGSAFCIRLPLAAS